MKKRLTAGFTLIEAMVSVAVFAILAVVASTLLFAVLRGVKKSAAVTQVRSEGAYVMEAMSKSIRFATAITSCVSGSKSIKFTPRAGDTVDTIYSCDLISGYVASNSSRLTSTKVKVTGCSIACTGNQVDISLTLEPATGGQTGQGGAIFNIDSTIVARNVPSVP